MRLVDAKPAKIGQGRRIHQVGFFLQRLVEDALDRRVTNQLRLPLGDMATVAQRNFFHRSFGNLRQKRSHTFRQHDVGLHLGVLFRRNRGNVHRILNDAMFQIFAHLLGNLHAHGFLRLISGAADVRR